MDWINIGEPCTGINIRIAEDHMNAVYITDMSIRHSDGIWSDRPYSVFWQKTPAKPEYSNYFCFATHGGKVYINSGASAAAEDFTGMRAATGEIIYSRFGHDFRHSTDGSTFIDGGRDYTRRGGNGASISLRFHRHRIVVDAPPKGWTTLPFVADHDRLDAVTRWLGENAPAGSWVTTRWVCGSRVYADFSVADNDLATVLKMGFADIFDERTDSRV